MNHRLPSGPAEIPLGTWVSGPSPNVVIAPAGVMRTIDAAPDGPSDLVNQRLPSGPRVMPPSPRDSRVGEVADVAGRRDAPDRVVAGTREPHVPISPDDARGVLDVEPEVGDRSDGRGRGGNRRRHGRHEGERHGQCGAEDERDEALPMPSTGTSPWSHPFHHGFMVALMGAGCRAVRWGRSSRRRRR